MVEGPWVTALGALGGATIGALAVLGSQTAEWRRHRATRWDEARREASARFLGRAHVYFLVLMDYRHCLVNGAATLDPAREHVREQRANLRLAKAEVDVTGGAATRAEADALLGFLSDADMDLSEADRQGPAAGVAGWEDYNQAYRGRVETFVTAARKELA